MIKTLLVLSGLEVTALHRAVLLEAVVWLSMLAAVVIDFMTGLRKARALNIPRDSHGLRRSFRKFADYGKVTGMLMLVDLLAISFGVYTLPYASGLSALGVIYTEYRSVRENLAAIKSAAVRMADVVALLAAASDRKEIAKLLQQYNGIKAAAERPGAKVEKWLNEIEKAEHENTIG